MHITSLCMFISRDKYRDEYISTIDKLETIHTLPINRLKPSKQHKISSFTVYAVL